MPAKLLEVNRAVINGYLGRTRGGKVSFTHLIGYAVVRAIADTVPAMNNSYLEGADGKPRIVRNEHVGLGIAVDVEKADGSRSLLVPVVKDADTLDFRGFWGSYEELIRKVRNNKLAPDDFSGITVSLTNPGTIGTVQSVPRLMPGQGLIVGVGSIDWPAEMQAADPETLADLGLSKVITISSTYDHRIIQGAESGMFLKRVHELLLGEDGFYDDIFRALDVPYEAVQWRQDVRPVDQEAFRLEKQMAVQRLINMYRVRGHLMADLDPLRWREPNMHTELDPLTYGLTIWDLERQYLTGGLAGQDRMTLRQILKVLRDAYCRTLGIEYMHIQDPDQKAWIQAQVEGNEVELEPEEQQHVLGRLNAAEAFEKFLATKYVGQKRFGLEGGESAIVILDAVLEHAAAQGIEKAIMGMAHRGRLNVLVNIVGKEPDKLFSEFEGHVPEGSVQGSGDVKYHLGQEGVYCSRHDLEIPVELAANPSHLEAVDPVVVGMVRALQDQIDRPEAFSVLPILIHGDAAFAGQGVVAETLQMSDIRGYRVGGTVHLVINNQIGYTTTPEASRSGIYSTDVAKMVQAPVFHVNGDDPEACVRAARLAFAFRQRFSKRRRHRHGLLPPPRPQRGRRPQLHPAPHVRQDRPAPVGPQAVHRVPGQAGAPVASRRPRPRSTTSRPACRPRSTRPAPTSRSTSPPSLPPPGACCPTSRPASTVPPSTRSSGRSTPSRSTSTSTPSWPSSSTPAARCGRTARSTGGWPSRSPSAHCCSRGSTSASPARTHGGARSPTATPRSTTTSPARSTCPSPTWPTARASSGSTTRCCRSTPPSGSSTATRSRTRRPWSPGRPSSATSSTAPRSSSTSSSSRPPTSGSRTPV